MFLLLPLFLGGQHLDNIVQAFEALNEEPEVIVIENEIDFPIDGGHLQGVQFVERSGVPKLLASGSSFANAYILQIDLSSKKAEKVVYLMQDPYRHAGGLQISGDFLVVGIEDNYAKTFSKVCFYPFDKDSLDDATPRLVIERKGEAKIKTAGASGLLRIGSSYLAIVSNWDSRDWDFYGIDEYGSKYEFLLSFAVSENWPSYQAINLISDNEDIYAIGFYELDDTAHADLILVSKRAYFEPIMKKVTTKSFNCSRGIDFNGAAGLQVDGNGQLHIWATQRNAVEEISINKFSEE
jgi:hypothetical protein